MAIIQLLIFYIMINYERELEKRKRKHGGGKNIAIHTETKERNIKKKIEK